MNRRPLGDYRIVRLNAELFPISAYEAELYRHYGLRPIEVEASAPADLIRHLADCDALFAISVSLPAAVIAALGQCRVISRLGTGTDKIAVEGAASDYLFTRMYAFLLRLHPFVRHAV